MSRLLVTAVALAATGLASDLGAQGTRPMQAAAKSHPHGSCTECVDCHKRGNCNVKVVLKEEGGKCKATGLKETHKIWHPKRGDTVVWRFQNDCATTQRAGVGHFGLHPEPTCTAHDKEVHKKHLIEKVDLKPDPFETPASRETTVRPGETGVVTLKLMKNAEAPRTYKYAITVDCVPLLDPEIEIERP